VKPVQDRFDECEVEMRQNISAHFAERAKAYQAFTKKVDAAIHTGVVIITILFLANAVVLGMAAHTLTGDNQHDRE
jgi:hypothetical protein